MRGEKVHKECPTCTSIFEDYVSNKRSGYCSLKCYWQARKNNSKYAGYWTGKERPDLWKGERLGYIGVHMWLRRKYGAANKCENRRIRCLGFECSGASKKFHWAFKSKKGYLKSRDNYFQLCASCHNRYDKAI